MINRLKKDIQAVFERDPAAKSVLEVLLNYPGLHAIWFYRVSHFFYKKVVCSSPFYLKSEGFTNRNPPRSKDR